MEFESIFEFELEFRTSETTGFLLLMTNEDSNSLSLSLELNDGKVIMTMDCGNEEPFYLEQEFANPFTVCDNRWHKVQGVINNKQLGLKVDELDQKLGVLDDERLAGTKKINLVYIGGIPGKK